MIISLKRYILINLQKQYDNNKHLVGKKNVKKIIIILDLLATLIKHINSISSEFVFVYGRDDHTVHKMTLCFIGYIKLNNNRLEA